MATRPISLNKYSTSSSSGDMSFDKPPSEDMQKPPIIYESKLSHTHTMIVLHGRGDTGQRFGAFFTISTINDEALDEILAHTKFIFPSAKRRRVMAASSEHIITMNQWFDIESLKDTNRGEVVQIEGLRDSSLHVREIIEEELNVIPAENIVLVGLSQGCATALFTLLTYRIPNPGKKDPPPRLGAVVGMSGWLPFEKRIVELLSAIQDDEKEVTSESNATQATSSEHLANATDSKKKPQPFSVAVSNKALSTICTLCSLPPFSVPNSPSTSTLPHTPVFMGHGTSDEKVSPELGEKARDTLRMLGFEVEWFPYQGFGVRNYLEPGSF